MPDFTKLRCFLTDRRAVTAIEYALMAAMISLIIITSLKAAGSSLTHSFTTTASEL
jgi:Flp pilus assembly pilin Flp